MIEETTYATVTAKGERFDHDANGRALPTETFTPIVATATSLPPLRKQAHNLLTTTVAWARSGFKKESAHNDRYQICLQCEYLVNQTRCARCGCWMEYKTKLAGATCPAGKW